MLDCSELTYPQMADLVRAVKMETMKRQGALPVGLAWSFNNLIEDLDTMDNPSYEVEATA